MNEFVVFLDSIFAGISNFFGSFNYLEFLNYLDKPFYVLFWVFFKNGGFLLYCGVLMWCIFKYYQNAINGKYASKSKKVYLSINIPKNNEQTPKSLEALFIQIASTNSSPNFKEKYFEGKSSNETFSFEIVSLGGYIQFIVGTPSQFRDLIESSIFAQYPDAEIIEVPDYTVNFPQKYPNEEYNLWGTELKITSEAKDNPDILPIRTYNDFIDLNAEENNFKDPLAAILEFMSKVNRDENVCIQILVRALPPSTKIDPWKEAARKQIKKIVGIEDKEEKKESGAAKLFKPFITIFKDIISMIIYNDLAKDPEAKKEEKKDTTNWMTKLLPNQKTFVENVEKKISKTPLECKIRLLYVAKKTVFSKGKVVSGLFGTIGQFNNPQGASLVSSKPVATSVDYFFVKKRVAERQNLLIKGYCGRSMGKGLERFYLNTEELVSLYHFPISTVKAPFLTKVESKKVEPPMDLPILE
ncbi:MAG TPA: hypothetical protein PLM63_02270 [bacterium]|nr:hypothetical protein [Patescibacteria group bacterium]HPO11381.1 hypothetical protein [bacterium]